MPSAAAAFGGTLPLLGGPSPFAAAINYNDTSGNTVGGFFASNTPATAAATSCGLGYQVNTLTSSTATGFTNATLFEFTFVETIAETFSVTNVGGVSLFVAGTEPTGTCTTTLCPGELLPASVGSPTDPTDSVEIHPGTFDLWYNAAGGLPAVLQATSTPLSATPLPATFPLFATGIGGLGLLGWLRKRKAQVGAQTAS